MRSVTGSVKVTSTVVASSASAPSRPGGVVSTSNSEFWRPGVPEAGSVVVPKLLAASDGPAGSMRSSEASFPPHAGRYGTTSISARTEAQRQTVSPELRRLGKLVEFGKRDAGKGGGKLGAVAHEHGEATGREHERTSERRGRALMRPMTLEAGQIDRRGRAVDAPRSTRCCSPAGRAGRTRSR